MNLRFSLCLTHFACPEIRFERCTAIPTGESKSTRWGFPFLECFFGKKREKRSHMIGHYMLKHALSQSHSRDAHTPKHVRSLCLPRSLERPAESHHSYVRSFVHTQNSVLALRSSRPDTLVAHRARLHTPLAAPSSAQGSRHDNSRDLSGPHAGVRLLGTSQTRAHPTFRGKISRGTGSAAVLPSHARTRARRANETRASPGHAYARCSRSRVYSFSTAREAARLAPPGRVPTRVRR
jgi:hypothetical protein